MRQSYCTEDNTRGYAAGRKAVVNIGRNRAHSQRAHEGGIRVPSRGRTCQGGRGEKTRLFPLPENALRSLGSLGATLSFVQEDRLREMLLESQYPIIAYINIYV